MNRAHLPFVSNPSSPPLHGIETKEYWTDQHFSIQIWDISIYSFLMISLSLVFRSSPPLYFSSAELVKLPVPCPLWAFYFPALLRKLPPCQKSHTNKSCTWAALALFALGKKLSFLSKPGHTCTGCLRVSIVARLTSETEGALPPPTLLPVCFQLFVKRWRESQWAVATLTRSRYKWSRAPHFLPLILCR